MERPTFRNRIIAMSFVATGLACGPSQGDDDAVEFDADCERDVSVPLIALADGEHFDDVYARGDGAVVLASTHTGSVYSPDEEPRDGQLLAVDGCGLAPREVLAHVGSIEAHPDPERPWLVMVEPQWPDAGMWLVETEDGGAAQRIPGEGVRRVLWTHDGVVVQRDTAERTCDLVHVWLDDDGALQETSLVAGAECGSPTFVTDTRPASKLATIREGEVVIADIATAEVEATGMAADYVWMVDGEADILLIQTVDPFAHVLTSRASGASIALGGEGSTSPSIVAASGAKSTWTIRGDDESQTQLVNVPELREYWFDGDWRSVASGAADGTRLLDGPEGLHRLGPQDTTPQLLLEERCAGVFGPDAFYVRVEPDVEGASAGRLLRIAIDGARIDDVFGTEVSAAWPVAEDRWVYLPGGELPIRPRLQDGDATRTLDAPPSLWLVGDDADWISVAPEPSPVLAIAPHGDASWLWSIRTALAD